ncbi:PASTA domain-containing protein [Niallia oryzisoli]|uniref:PASTA domain-containing protein n=1 Tax=Niallia oryzisoli TaxID=1737571 RepID=A0ABZ2CAA6_9BACI
METNTEKESRTILVETKSNGSAVTALVLGIIGVVVGFIPYIGWFMIPVWLLAIIFGFIGMRKKFRRKMAVTGLALGILGAVYKIGFWIVAAGGLFAAIAGNGSATETDNTAAESTPIVETAGTEESEQKDAEKIEVPFVEGEDVETTESILTEKGFTIGEIIEMDHKEIPKGEVIETKPAYGELATSETPIDIYVSGGTAEELTLENMETREVKDVIDGRKDQIFVFVYFNAESQLQQIDEGEENLLVNLNSNLAKFNENDIEVIGIIDESTEFTVKEKLMAQGFDIPFYLNTDEAYNQIHDFFFTPDINVQNGAGEIITENLSGESFFFDEITVDDVVNEILDKAR